MLVAGIFFDSCCSWAEKEERASASETGIFVGCTKSREESGAVVFDKRIKVNEHLLVDAGFDRYVKMHWDKLLSNASMKIDYLVPSRLTTVGFEVGRVNCLANTRANAVCFAITPTSWFVSLAVDPITVAYDPDTRNLLRFNGRGNIASSDGKYQTVDIRYQYPE